MRLLGYNIQRANKFAEDEKKRKKSLAKEIGDTGTQIYYGDIDDEYNNNLKGTDGVTVYDKMRRSDGTIRAVIAITGLPIRRARWFIQPASEDKKDQEIRDFLDFALFEYMDMVWDDLLRQALLMLPFGVMVFEKVFEIGMFEGKEVVLWKKLGPRMPASIESWATEDNKTGIRQNTSQGNVVSIPIEKLLVFVNDMEGENWWGSSILRAAYRNWKMKQKIELLDMIAHEKQAIGIPYANAPDGATQAEMDRAEEILKNARAHNNQYVLMPAGWEFGFQDMKGDTTRNPEKSIERHSREIMKSVLAQFLDLGTGSVGSRALSEDHSDMFLKSLEAVANNIAGVFNKYAIPQLVDLNFSNVEKYPTLEFADISRRDVNAISTAYQRLVQVNVIEPTEDDERYMRELLNLPDADNSKPKEKKEEPESKKVDDDDLKEANEDLGLTRLFKKFKKKILLKHHEVKIALEERVAGWKLADQLEYLDLMLHVYSNYEGASRFTDVVQSVLTSKKNEVQRMVFQENNDFKSWRPLTFAEKKVDFQRIQDMLDKMEEEFTQKADEILAVAQADYVRKLAKALEEKDKKTIKALKLKAKNEYEQLLKDAMRDAYVFGKANASREMGVSTPSNSQSVMTQIDILAASIAEKHMDELEYIAKVEMVTQLEAGKTLAQTMGAIDVAIDKKKKDLIKKTSGTVMSGQLNNGRNTVFERNSGKIYALQRSEILDRKTCNFCLSIDGRIIEKTDSLARKTIFHSNCRGIWVEILQEEEEKPRISGVPKSIRDKAGDGINDLKQPRKPIVKKSSLAKKKIDEGKAGRQ